MNAIPDRDAFAARLYAGNSFHPPRPVLAAIKRGFAGNCPACGGDALFVGFLRRRHHCRACGEELRHSEPDGLSCLLVVPAALSAVCALSLLLDAAAAAPLALQIAACAAVGAITAVGLSPRANGLAIGLAWAVRLRDFDPVERVRPTTRNSLPTDSETMTSQNVVGGSASLASHALICCS